jgi:recombination protein RecR
MSVLSPSLLNLIESLRCLPGVGQKTAQRLAINLMGKNRVGAEKLKTSIATALDTISNCNVCQVLTDNGLCPICQNPRRDIGQLCIVESPLDLLAIEGSSAYQGRYFVLNGKISPLDGVGPKELKLNLLEEQLSQVKEIILAISPTVEGTATAHYISEMLVNTTIKISRIAYGVPFGGELEYLDHQTLSHAFTARS